MATRIKDTGKYLGKIIGTFPSEKANFIKAQLSQIAVGQTVYTYMAWGAFRCSKIKAIGVDGDIVLDCPNPLNPQSTVYVVPYIELWVKAE